MSCFSTTDIGGCGCTTPTCSQTFAVQGCNALAYAGLTVSVYASSGGSPLASGTTSSLGKVTLSWSGSCSVYVTITGQSSRFAAYGQSLSLTTGGTRTIALTVASGYVCIVGCLVPTRSTLSLSASSGATASLAYNSTTARFTGSGTYAYPGCGNVACGCAAASIPVVWTWIPGGQIFLYAYLSAPSNCPNATATGTLQEMAGIAGFGVTVTCPPAFSVTGTLVDEDGGCFYCGNAGDAITITE